MLLSGKSFLFWALQRNSPSWRCQSNARCRWSFGSFRSFSILLWTLHWYIGCHGQNAVWHPLDLDSLLSVAWLCLCTALSSCYPACALRVKAFICGRSLCWFISASCDVLSSETGRTLNHSDLKKLLYFSVHYKVSILNGGGRWGHLQELL